MARRGGPKPDFMGKMNKILHRLCRRCGNHAFHKSHKVCAKCGFGTTAKLRTYSWKTKSGMKHAVRKTKAWIPSQGKNRSLNH